MDGDVIDPGGSNAVDKQAASLLSLCEGIVPTPLAVLVFTLPP
jgi:hypothetical protein